MYRVLFIGAGAPWIGGAGYLVRQRMFLQALAEIADLTLAMFSYPDAAPTATPAYVRRLVKLPPVPRKIERGVRGLIGDLLSPSPRMIRGAKPAAARHALAQLRPETFDALFAYRIDFAEFSGVLDHPRLLLDVDDPEHLRWQRQLAATTRDGGDRRTRADLVKLARFEKRAARGAFASFVCQENDQSVFDPPPTVVPNCVDVPAACPPRNAGQMRILFLGNFSPTSPNTDGLRWFLSEAWPLILGQSPQAQLQVVGKLSTDAEKLLHGAPRAASAGFVENLPKAMSHAALSIAPIRFGTGTRVKIIESFAMGCPVVSTTLGYEGIAAAPETHLLAADTPADFAQQCVRLLNDPDLQRRLSQAAYDLAAKTYSESARRPQLVKTLRQQLDRVVTR